MDYQLSNHYIDQLNDLGRKKVPFLFVIDFEGEKPFVTPYDAIDPDQLLFTFEERSNHPRKINDESIVLVPEPVSFEDYQQAFAEVVKKQVHGYSYLLNLTFPARLNNSQTLTEIYNASVAPYKLLYKNKFLVFSPETFVKIRDGYISSFPMKGTIDASVPDAREKILDNEKEMAEHVTIVDLIRNDLSRVASDVEVIKFRYISRIVSRQKQLLQVSSEIRANCLKTMPAKSAPCYLSFCRPARYQVPRKQKHLRLSGRWRAGNEVTIPA